ncbi:MAG TPA: FecR family protein [Candidatus Angelobacter sp.]|nr:FecR family protein [Candidatus Angelobacter sp.]
MKTKFTVTMLWILLCSLMSAAQEPQNAPMTAPFAGATVSDFRGKLSIQMPGQNLSAPTRGQVLPAETLISTENSGSMLLRLSDGSDLLVRSNTRLILKTPEPGAWRYLQLLIGRVRAEIQKRIGGAPGFQIGTPSAVISVRGTVFDVEVNRTGITEVDVHEGVVQLDSTKGLGESVLVRAGYSSRVSFESGPETPRRTEDIRPELERPGRSDSKHHGRDDDDDPIKRLRSSSGDERHDAGGSRGSSGDSDRTGSSGSSGDSGSSGGSGDSSSGSGSGSHDSGSSGDGGGHDSHRPPER